MSALRIATHGQDGTVRGNATEALIGPSDDGLGLFHLALDAVLAA